MNIVAARRMMLTGKNPGGFSRYEMCTDRVAGEVER